MVQIELQSLREDAGMTQQELASRLRSLTGEAWDQSKVSRYEADPEKAPLGAIMAMLQVLGVDNPYAFLASGVSRAGGEGVDVGHPLASLHRDLALLREYVAAPSWDTSDPTLQIPYPSEVEFLCDRLSQKPSVAFFGKFDVGKSTLVNTVLGSRCMPTAYQPATRVVVYARHIGDRPKWLREDVLMLDGGFVPDRWLSEEHCLEHKVVAGGLETLQAHGTHRGLHGETSASQYALVFIDAPVLNSCNIVDLPGTENDTTDTGKATAREVAFDVAVFADTVQGFLGEGTLLRLGEVVRRLPMLESPDLALPPLCNLLIVATHAHRDISDWQLREEILPGGRARAWRQLGSTALESRAAATGVQVTEAEFADRFFAFYKDIPDRRTAVLKDLGELLSTHLPVVLRREADSAVERLREESTGALQKKITYYQQAVTDRTLVEEELTDLRASEPQRAKVTRYARQAVESAIARHRVEMRESLKDYLHTRTSPEHIEKVIRADFHSKKDAQQNAAALVLERIQSHVENDARRRTEEVARLIEDFIEEYEQAPMAGRATPGPVHIPFNAKGAFAGGLVGLAAVGGLALWASTLGNLGAYIIVAQAVSAVSALGISTGGTAVWISAVSSIGGPVTIAIGIVVLATVLGWALLRGSWEDRLAKKIASELGKSDIESGYLDRMDIYWDETAEAFAAGADQSERAWQAHLDELQRTVDETDLDILCQRLARLEEMRSFFLMLPWVETQGSITAL